jgi:hypothetical protein
LKNIKTIIVMDRMGSLGTELTPLATEVKSIIMREVLNLEYGRGGRNTPRILIEEIFRIGLMLGWSSTKNIEAKQIHELLNNDRMLRTLLQELETLKGADYAARFKELIAASRFIEAFGPKEHIDVREKTKLRDIKLSILERTALQLAGGRTNGKSSDTNDLLILSEFGYQAQK